MNCGIRNNGNFSSLPPSNAEILEDKSVVLREKMEKKLEKIVECRSFYFFWVATKSWSLWWGNGDVIIVLSTLQVVHSDSFVIKKMLLF